MSAHYGHEPGLWFYGCDACNPVEMDITAPKTVERVRAAIRLLYPDEMTPTAKRVLERILEDSE